MSISSAMRMTGVAKAEVVRLAMGLGVLGVTATGLSSLATGAFFGDHKDVSVDKIVSGSVVLGVTPASAALSLGNMAPGDSAVSQLTVSNGGTLEERYTAGVTTTGDAGLAGRLLLTVKRGVTSCTPGGFDSSGSVVTSVPLNTVGALFTKEMAAHSDNDVLCVRVFFPPSTRDLDNPLQSKTVTATLNFDSEQTANNPLPTSTATGH